MGSEPEVWRAFTIDGSRTLRDLHLALQIIVGWHESHLHIFSDTDPYQRRPAGPGRRWGSPDGELDVEPEDETTIAEAVASGGPLWYEYDLGDSWMHRIDLLEQVQPTPLSPPVHDVDGANRAPYEDAGGIHGYLEKLQITADPQHPDHRFITSWIAATVGPWAPAEPAFFDPVGAQTELNLMFNPAASGTDRLDMSGIVKDEAHRTDDDFQLDAPLADLLGNLPVPIRAELRQLLHRSGILEPTGIDDAAAARIIRPYVWLVDTVGTGGLPLTQAGWMPPATVLAAMTELGWTENWIGKGNREDLTVPVAHLRATAQRMGLVRVQKGRLLLGADARRALGKPRMLLRQIARRIYRGMDDAVEMSSILHLLAIALGVPEDQRWRTVSFGLGMLGWEPSGPGSPDFTPLQVDSLTRVVDEVLHVLTWHRRYGGDESEDLALFAREALR